MPAIVAAKLEISVKDGGSRVRRSEKVGMKSFCWSVLLAMLSLPARALAQAGPPYQTDDPDPVEYHHWEFYVASQDLRTSDGASGTLPHVEVNFGALPGVQLHLLVPLAYAREGGGRTAFGFGDVEAGAKVQFVKEGTRRPMVGTFVQTEWPAANAADGLGTGHVRVLIPLWLQKSFGPWSTDAGGGFWVNPGAGNRDYWIWGWQVQRRLSDRATLGTEAFYTSSDHVGGRSSLMANVGLVVNITERHHVLFSAGHSAVGDRALQSLNGRVDR
jgi:hypothetical protein